MVIWEFSPLEFLNSITISRLPTLTCFEFIICSGDRILVGAGLEHSKVSNSQVTCLSVLVYSPLDCGFLKEET